MSDMTARFGLPFILPGQAQKEMFHNEALARIDAALHACAESVIGTPPETPEGGLCWIVAPGAAGDWAGQDGSIACWTSGGWRFVAPATGMEVWDTSTSLALRWDGGAWSDGSISAAAIRVGGEQVVGSRQPPVPTPSGGTIIDAEARASIAEIIAALMSHGLIG